MAQLDPERFSSSQEWHLARSKAETELTNFELALMFAYAAFERYVVQTCRLVGGPELGFNEAVILHVVRMHDRPKDAATVARLLNRDDLPNVQYALRKLLSFGLIERVKVGQTAVFQPTEIGLEWTDRYAALRRQVLSEIFANNSYAGDSTASLARAISVKAGLFDAAARASAVLNPSNLFDEP